MIYRTYGPLRDPLVCPMFVYVNRSYTSTNASASVNGVHLDIFSEIII